MANTRFLVEKTREPRLFSDPRFGLFICCTSFYAVRLFSHKEMRYFVPFFLIAILITSAILTSEAHVYLILLIARLVCYLSAFAACYVERLGVRNRLLALPQYFVLANVASVIAFYQFLHGERYAAWEPIREGAQPSAAKLSHSQSAVE